MSAGSGGKGGGTIQPGTTKVHGAMVGTVAGGAALWAEGMQNFSTRDSFPSAHGNTHQAVVAGAASGVGHHHRVAHFYARHTRADALHHSHAWKTMCHEGDHTHKSATDSCVRRERGDARRQLHLRGQGRWGSATGCGRRAPPASNPYVHAHITQAWSVAVARRQGGGATHQVGVADPTCGHFDEDFAVARLIQLQVLNQEGLFGPGGHCGSDGRARPRREGTVSGTQHGHPKTFAGPET